MSTIQIVEITSSDPWTIGTVTNLPLPKGRYFSPQFSPVDNNKLVYTRLSGDTLSGSTYSNNAGIYIATKTG